LLRGGGPLRNTDAARSGRFAWSPPWLRHASQGPPVARQPLFAERQHHRVHAETP